MGLENNKTAHHIQVCDNGETKITHIGWATSRIESLQPERSSIGGRLGEGLFDGDDLPMDLPRELTFLEMDTALPKISPLPSSSAGGG